MVKYNLTDDTWDKQEYDAINEVLSTGVFTMGEKTKEYEIKFAENIGSKYAVMVNSGSSANLLAVAALVYSKKLQKGDEIIVPAVSWSTTYYPLYQYGLKLNFVDIDLNTLNLDIEKLDGAITKKTKAIFAVNLLGNPNNYTRIIEACNKYNLILIEDNCEALGASFNGKNTGTFGIIGTFSTFYSHHISTMEGGVAVTDDEELYHFMLSLRAHGWTRDLPPYSSVYKKANDDFYESYNFILPGYNLRPLEFEAAVGLKQLEKLNHLVASRRQNAQYYVNSFKDYGKILIQQEVGQSSWFGFSILLRDDMKGKRDIVVKELIRAGIEVRPIVAGNFTKNPVIKYFDYKISGHLNNADYIHENGFFVGNHSQNMTKNIDLLKSSFSVF